jgi:hypothetical protein
MFPKLLLVVLFFSLVFTACVQQSLTLSEKVIDDLVQTCTKLYYPRFKILNVLES